MTIKPEEIEIKNLDHLGIVAGIIDDLGIVSKINKILKIDSREKINAGQVVKAIILNGLGFVAQPLYLFSQFFADKPIEHLLGAGLKAEDLNDDKLGRVMAKLYRSDLTKTFLEIALAAVKKYGISTKYSHLDSTSLSVQGEYNEPRESPSPNPEISPTHPIKIVQGYSRNHRPDLKQCVLDLIVSSDGDVPIFLRTGDGNESDKAVFGEILVEFKSQIDFDSIMVGDSALYSQNNLKLMGNLKWISRVPFSLKLAKHLVQSLTADELEPSALPGYSYREEKVIYAELEQRWLVVESSARRKNDLEKLEQKIASESKKAVTEIGKLIQQEFRQAAAANCQIQELKQRLKYHQITNIKVLKVSRQSQPITYKIQAQLTRDEVVIVSLQQQAGRFILATNCLDKQQLSSAEILTVYKRPVAE
jgi:transposase